MKDPFLKEDYFNFLVLQECKRAERYEYFFSIVAVSLENSESPHFSQVAALIRKIIREGDILGIVRGNNLATILHHADAQCLSPIISRLRETIQLQIPENPLETTVKIGGACFPSDACTGPELINAALA